MMMLHLYTYTSKVVAKGAMVLLVKLEARVAIHASSMVCAAAITGAPKSIGAFLP